MMAAAPIDRAPAGFVPPHVLAMGEALALSLAEQHTGDILSALRWLWLQWRACPNDEEQEIQRVATRVLLDVADEPEAAAWRTWWAEVGGVLVLTTQVARRRLAMSARPLVLPSHLVN